MSSPAKAKRLIVFDFDQTISTFHVFSLLSGQSPAPESLLIPLLLSIAKPFFRDHLQKLSNFSYKKVIFPCQTSYQSHTPLQNEVNSEEFSKEKEKQKVVIKDL